VVKLCSLLFIASACSFSASSLDVQPDAQGSDAGSPAAPPVDAPNAACHSQLAGLVLCFDFEDPSLDPSIRDSSTGGHDATAANVAPLARSQQQAAMVGSSSSITVPESSALDLAGPLSLELWLDPATAAQRDTVLSHSVDYGMDFDGLPGCYVVDAEAWAAQALPPGWHHVACTFDGGTIRVYVDGSVVGCASARPPQAHAAEIGISERFSGGIDDVHLYDRALAAGEVQALAGVTSGTTTCPTNQVD
jgi:hypothetical protein